MMIADSAFSPERASLESLEPGTAPTEILWDLGRAYYAYVGLAERVLVDEGLGHILRPGMGQILLALYEHDDYTIKELSARLQLANSTLTGLLTRMEKAGLVVRARDAEDGRLARVSLTPLSRELESKCRAIVGRVTKIAHDGIGQENIAQARSMLRGLTSAFRQEEQRLSKK